MTWSAYARNKILDHVFGGGAYTRPASLFAQLHSADPTTAGTVGQITAIPRAAITNDATHFPAASAGSKTNGLEISWGSTSGQNGLATATYVSLWDALTSGNMIAYGALAVSFDPSDRVKVSIPAGSATFTEV